MRKRGVSSTLTVYHDGQFWVGVVEHVENSTLSVARMVFGAEPSNEELYAWLLAHWSHLQLSTTTGSAEGQSKVLARNPKRRQREASKELRKHRASTASQRVLAQERDHLKAESRSARVRRHREDELARREKQHEKKKRKHRGK